MSLSLLNSFTLCVSHVEIQLSRMLNKYYYDSWGETRREKRREWNINMGNSYFYSLETQEVVAQYFRFLTSIMSSLGVLWVVPTVKISVSDFSFHNFVIFQRFMMSTVKATISIILSFVRRSLISMFFSINEKK